MFYIDQFVAEDKVVDSSGLKYINELHRKFCVLEWY